MQRNNGAEHLAEQYAKAQLSLSLSLSFVLFAPLLVAVSKNETKKKSLVEQQQKKRKELWWATFIAHTVHQHDKHDQPKECKQNIVWF